ncbi:NAD-dependent epimerase/dehydratase family protein [Streptacidiphilus sp. PAMC 29251]
MPPLLLVTGGSGTVARVLRPALSGHYRLRTLSLPTGDAGLLGADEETVFADMRNAAMLDRAVRGVDAVLHLAALADPRADWARASANIEMTAQLLAAVERQGVAKVVLASSTHAAGLNYRDGPYPVDPRALPQPCCPYGAAKVAAESLGRIHARRTGASVVSLRFGLVGWPLTERDYAPMWLSDRDASALVLAALATRVGEGVYFGVSRYAASFWDLGPGRADLGFEPADPLPRAPEELPWSVDPPCLMFPA